MAKDVKKTANGYAIEVNGKIVTAKFVILATHYPIINSPGFYFLKMYQSTSYAIAFETPNPMPDDMYITASSPFVSFKTVPFERQTTWYSGGW